MINAVCWILVIIIFLGLEAATTVLVSIWFAGGALVSLIATLCGANINLQILLFLLVSLLCVALLRRIALKNILEKRKQTNLDRIIGENVVITQVKDNTNNQGVVRINDVDWKVKSANGESISVGEVVTVTDIEGVKLIVKK